MKILLLICIVFFSLSINAHALELAPEKIFFGEAVEQQEAIIREITIKNNETNTILINKIRVSCECLIIDFKEEQVVQPDESLKITVTLDPSKLSKGKFRKYLFLEIKDSEKPLYAVEVSGTIL